MTEEEARETVLGLVGDDAFRRLALFVHLVVEEAGRQNLVSSSTLPVIWGRHILDSVQLISHARAIEGTWLDVGTGGGFPGLAVAACTGKPTMLVEPRRLRAQFLGAAAEAMHLSNVEVVAAKIESVTSPAAIISSRAVAPIEKLLHAAARCATPATRWLFLRGRMEADEMKALRRSPMMFHVEQSLTDSRSSIVIGEGRP